MTAEFALIEQLVLDLTEALHAFLFISDLEELHSIKVAETRNAGLFVIIIFFVAAGILLCENAGCRGENVGRKLVEWMLLLDWLMVVVWFR